MATRQIFSALDRTGDATVSSQYFLGFLNRNGLQKDDPRLAGMHANLSAIGGLDSDVMLTIDQFAEAIASCSTLVHKCVSGELRIPDFSNFAKVVEEVYKIVEPNKSGDNAQYIPQLAEVDPEQFAISVTTVDGQHYSIGDSDTQFCIQSCSKPITYLIAQTELGPEYVHRHIGTEPSGRAFNEMTLKDAPLPGFPGRKIPHNPCINAGAIMAVSMAYPTEKTRDARHKKVLKVWEQLSGPDAPIGYDEATYKSESGSADRNWCLGYMMKHDDAFPPCFSDLGETLELYFQICSTLSTNKAMSRMAATLANGGLNPMSGERVFAADHVRNALPIMMMAGMYDYSGQWAFDIGVPAKSGVGGCVFIVVPNVCGIAIWSPRLDAVGNSARGVHAATELGKHFQLNNFEVFSGLSRTKIDPTMPKNAGQQAKVGALLFAASQGDTAALEAQHNSGINLHASDYDQRTAMHLAASEGHAGALQFLVDNAKGDGAVLNAVDRWGGTPLSDASSNNHEDCAAILKAAGAAASDVAHAFAAGDDGRESSSDAPQVLYAAADGDLDELIKLNASGTDLFVSDYDGRTALHLACSNGKEDAVGYLVAQSGDQRAAVVGAKDRWGFTAADDATRGSHAKCSALLA